jgi:hypothetical protein
MARLAHIRIDSSYAPIGERELGAERDLGGEARKALWKIVESYLFAEGEQAVRWVWTADPIGGDPERMPDDVRTLLEGWFRLVEVRDVRSFLAAVFLNLEPSKRAAFAAELGSEELGLLRPRDVTDPREDSEPSMRESRRELARAV